MTDWKFLFEKYVLKQHKWGEGKVIKTIRKFHGDLFIDIGSNRKFYAGLLKQNFKQVLTIDPNPKWDADLKIALSNHSGRAPFYIGNDNGSADSLLQDPHIHRRKWLNQTNYDVEVSTFDELGLDADLVKIDVEGAEFDVLEGMKKHVPRNLIVELHDERRETELLTRLSTMGYHVIKIDQTHFLGRKYGGL